MQVGPTMTSWQPFSDTVNLNEKTWGIVLGMCGKIINSGLVLLTHVTLRFSNETFTWSLEKETWVSEEEGRH